MSKLRLTDKVLKEQATLALRELNRAREMQHSGREAWFEGLMNTALDVLAARYLSQDSAPVENPPTQ